MSTNTLWAHLLRKDISASQSSQAQAPVPPLAPHEKTSTSVRILLHDTQANVEKFSERVGQLITNVADTKKELLDVKKSLKDEQEQFRTEVYDLVNRSQREIQRSVGTPAQASSVEQLSKDTSLRLDGLDKRLDILHSLQKTVSEILQTQSGTLQAIQNQQAALTNALLPLLNPVHRDSARPSKHKVAYQTSSPGTTLHGTSDPVSSSPTKHPLSPPASFSTQKGTPKSSRKRKRATPGGPELESSTASKRTRPSTDTPSRKLFETPIRQAQQSNDMSAYSNMSNHSKISVGSRSITSARTPINLGSRRDSRIPDLSHRPASSSTMPRHSVGMSRSTSKMASSGTASTPIPFPQAMLPPDVPESALRARRSPFRPGRRFIPLDDSDSEDSLVQ